MDLPRGLTSEILGHVRDAWRSMRRAWQDRQRKHHLADLLAHLSPPQWELLYEMGDEPRALNLEQPEVKQLLALGLLSRDNGFDSPRAATCRVDEEVVELMRDHAVQELLRRR